MIYIIIALVIGLLISLALTHKVVVRLVAEKRALPKIENILFSESKQNKQQVLKDIHELTNHRLSDDMVMDYFYKIKGLQVVNIHQPTSFWLKIYLTTPTKVKLNYFEQVKFYETFLNYPAFKNSKSKSKENSKANKLETKIKDQLINKLMPQKLA